jgi:F-type H+-transporting ATPase subunit delta
MKITKHNRRDAKQLFRSCVVGAALDEGRVRRTVAAVIAQKPHGYLAILAHFQRLVKLDLARRAASVESPGPLSSDLQGRVTQRLGELYGAGLDIAFAQNPALIGGLRIKVGSDVYDGSVKARLTALAESF